MPSNRDLQVVTATRLQLVKVAREWHDDPTHGSFEQLIFRLKTKTIKVPDTMVVAKRPPVVCLCGSTRFMDAFHEAGWQFTLDGYVVLTVAVCKHAEHHGAEALGPDVVERLDELHLRKIDMASLVFVLNVGGYIGDSTRREIEYARKQGKQVSYLEPVDGGGDAA